MIPRETVPSHGPALRLVVIELTGYPVWQASAGGAGDGKNEALGSRQWKLNFYREISNIRKEKTVKCPSLSTLPYEKWTTTIQ